MPGSPAGRRLPLDVQADALVDRFLADRASGVVSVWYAGLDRRPRYQREAHTPHYAASTMKLPLLVAGHRLAERGLRDLDAPVAVQNRFASAADGTPFAVDEAEDQDPTTWARLGTTMPLRELLHQAVVASGNLATNLALAEVGLDAVAAVLQDAGCSPATRVCRGIEDTAARAAGLDNTVTAQDLALVMVGIADRSLAGEATCAAVEAVLAAQVHRDKIPAGLPSGTYVANKTGWVSGVAHDVALVRPEDAEPYVLAVCTSVDVPDATASALIADLSRCLWEARPS